ncbi:MAG TPA: DEDD exonuclease domain-containing protein [Nocardioidaceae bacterium]|nr:DEDD exonuclease domain-containing protein [Nocardioidaceae bacterium]
MSSLLESSPPAHPRGATAAGRVVQGSFDELGRPLRDATFCVVDLETTGGSAAGGAGITEIGAVKVRGGEVVGEFQSLVNPQTTIPAFISVLTGITDGMVASAPTVAQVLPAFLEFARGTVLVAHNAPFDLGFLRHYAGELALPWPAFEVVDTARLARRVLTRDDAPNCKLSTLARVFSSPTPPTHRALEDARATVHVLHGLFERLGPLGVQTLEELHTFSSRVTPQQRKKRHLAEQLPHAPGVYLFRDHRDRVLYVGTSRDIRTRVRTYFTASETRSRMGEMVGLAESVVGIACATTLEAQVRELRLIKEHKPRYNRRSRHPERAHWVKVTVEPWPRLSLVRRVLDDGATYLGPFSSRRSADRAVAALHEAFPIRQCTGRMPREPRQTPCALAEMGRCLSPCDRSVDTEPYAALVERLRHAVVADPHEVIGAVERRMAALSAACRFEDAAVHRDRLSAFVRAAARRQRLVALTRCAEVVAARRTDGATWEVHVVRHGRLAAAGVIPPGAHAGEWVRALRASAETVVPGPGPAPATTAEETERILRWLESDGVRLVHLDGEWSCPIGGAEGHRRRLDAVDASKTTLVPFEDRRDLPVHHQPAR